MFIAEAGKIMLFGFVMITLSVALFAVSIVALLWSWRVYRRGRKSLGASVGAVALTFMVGVPSTWAYAFMDHRPYRTVQIDFRGLQQDVLREPDTYCRPSLSEVSCDSQKYVTDLSVRLHDGSVLSLLSSLLSWRVDGQDVLQHISFRSNDTLSLAQVQAALGKDRRLVDGSFSDFDRNFVAISKWLVECADGSAGCSYKRVCFRSRPDLVCATYIAQSRNAFKIEYEIARTWKGRTGS